MEKKKREIDEMGKTIHRDPRAEVRDPGRPDGVPPLDPDIAQAAFRIQTLRDAGHLRDARRLVLHLKPNGKRIGSLEVGSVRSYEVTDKG